VKRLEAMTDADMKKWMETLMPPGTKCIFVFFFAVSGAEVLGARRWQCVA
jgi:hypothetical protein